jgi:PEP-CTERM motif
MKAFALAAALVVAAPVFAADYLPSGPQLGVSIGTVTGGGWSLCYSALMGTAFGDQASVTLANCGAGTRIMMAGRETGSDTLLVLAQTTKADAFAATGAANNDVFTTSNGADWFYNDDWSWGFKPIGADFDKFQCDGGGAPIGSMCIHTLNFVGGFSINDIIGLNGSDDYEKLVFVFDGGGVIPEPATWAMLITGFGLVGVAARRRRLAAA